jgi:general secretion pathway protein I
VRARATGFTLIEVLVALAIVAIGMSALLAALSSSADSATYLRDKSFAEWVALNRIQEVRVALQRPKTGKTDGEAEMAGQKWRWSQEVLETEVKGILRIDVSVRPSSLPIAADSDTGWYTTVSGIVGDAVAPARGILNPFDEPPQPGGPGGPGGPDGDPQNPGQNPQNPSNPGQNPNPPPKPPVNEPNPNPTD